MNTKKLKLGVLVSGRGSNLDALIKASQDKNFPAEIATVISNKTDIPALDKALKANIPHHAVIFKKGEPPEKGEQVILDLLKKYGVNLLVLAGFMRILSSFFISRFKNYIINIHPALLPSFPGLNAQKQALEAGIKESGCTVHFVDEGCDTGPIILQSKVPVLSDDTVESLSARILAEEHKIFPQAVKLIAEGRVSVYNQRVSIKK